MGQITGFEIKHLFAYVQFGTSCISMYHVSIFSRNLGYVYLPPFPDSILGGPAQPGAGGDVRQDLWLLASRTEGPVLNWRPDNIFQTIRLPRLFTQSHKRHSSACLCICMSRWSVMRDKSQASIHTEQQPRHPQITCLNV